MGVSFRVAAVFVLSDPKIKAIAGHVRLDAPVTRRTTVIERQLAGNDVGDNIGLSHCEAAHRVRRNLFFVFVVVIARIEAVFELVGTTKDKVFIGKHVHHIRGRRSGEEKRRAGRGIDETMHGIHRYGEKGALLPFESEFFAVAFGPNLCRPSAFDDQVHLFVHVLLGVERAGSRDFDHITAPKSFRS